MRSRTTPADLDAAARAIVAEAFERGSADNLTALVVRVDALPTQNANEVHAAADRAAVSAGAGAAHGVRRLHRSCASCTPAARSHVYLASYEDRRAGGHQDARPPSCSGDAAHLERFLMEDWVAQRISNAHVMKAAARGRKRNFYTP